MPCVNSCRTIWVSELLFALIWLPSMQMTLVRCFFIGSDMHHEVSLSLRSMHISTHFTSVILSNATNDDVNILKIFAVPSPSPTFALSIITAMYCMSIESVKKKSNSTQTKLKERERERVKATCHTRTEKGNENFILTIIIVPCKK